MTRALLLLSMLTASVGCTDDQDPERAAALWERLQSMDYRNTFARAPGYDQRVESRAAHGDEVVVFVNDVVADALAGPRLEEWPDGSLFVKDGYSGGEVCLIAALEKVDGVWFWAEWRPGGDSIFSGTPELCTSCHAPGEDNLRSVYLPD